MDRLTVLMAEDEEEWSDYVSYLLPPERYEIISASTAKGALRLAVERRPDLAILDMNLPDMFGIELCRTLRGLPGMKSIPVVALSNLDHETTSDPEMTLDGFVRKTSASRDLLPTVELLRSRRPGAS